MIFCKPVRLSLFLIIITNLTEKTIIKWVNNYPKPSREKMLLKKKMNLNAHQPFAKTLTII